jgi:ribonuclease HI
VIEDEVGRPVAGLSEYLGRQTNNYAEYSGLLASLNYTLRHGFKAMKVISDSELMVKQINGEYKVSSPTLKELHARALQLIDQLDCFEITHVLREKNREADRLANLAMDRGIAKKAPAVSATDVGGVASVVPEFNGVVRDGVVQFVGNVLPEGTLVKIRAVKP